MLTDTITQLKAERAKNKAAPTKLSHLDAKLGLGLDRLDELSIEFEREKRRAKTKRTAPQRLGAGQPQPSTTLKCERSVPGSVRHATLAPRTHFRECHGTSQESESILNIQNHTNAIVYEKKEPPRMPVT